MVPELLSEEYQLKAGAVSYTHLDVYKRQVFPRISQCFGDTSVTLEAAFCGGIVAGAPRPADINDCYFVGKLIGERVGGIVGNSWTEYEGATVTHCYSATADADLLGNGKSSVTNSSTRCV